MTDVEPQIGEGGPFTISLELVAVCCPQCGEAREPGLCPQCGLEIGASEEVTDMARARGRALGSIQENLERLIERFGETSEGSIPVSNDQFATVVGDAGLFDLIAEMTGIGGELEALDLNDRAVIGAELREKMLKRLGKVETLAEVCEELALFAPDGPAGELRTVAAESGRYGARLTLAFIRILVAETISDARGGEAEMQELLEGFPYGGRIDELLAQMRSWTVPDFDARAELVLGRPGSYCDEFGFLDVGAVFGAYSDQEEPFEALAACGRRYFSHLLGEDTVGDAAIESFLVIPAIGLATLDRPLAAHRIAHSTYELLVAASEREVELVQGLLDRTVAEGQLIFEAIDQIRRGMKLLAAGEEAGIADEGAALKTIMEAYRDLAETSFRTYGRLTVDLDRVTRGMSLGEEPDPPTLGTLTDQLAASPKPAGRRLAACSESALRNACAHAQYRWDSQSKEVHDMRTGQRWSLEELEASLEAMSTAIAGADAGYSCFLASGRAEVRTPDWARGGSKALTPFVAGATFGARGFQVLGVTDDGLSIEIEDEAELDAISLMSTLGGMVAIAQQGEVMRVLGASGRLLMEVEMDTFREAREAPPKFKDLAIMLPFFSNAKRTTDDYDKALIDWVAVMLGQVVMGIEVDFSVPAMLAAADRLGYVGSFVKANRAGNNEELAAVVKPLSRCRGHASAVACGNEQARAGFAKELLVLNEWVTGRSPPWPPPPL